MEQREPNRLATGLAWTQVGGEILYVEASLIGGKGDLIVTGQIGEVMQESARAALSPIPVPTAKELGIKTKIFDNNDVHIHVPAGAIPKDGPSAGIAIATALISALSVPVSKDIAMTGEMTLRGRVLPVGGLKEKALAALRAKVYKVVLPEKNRKDLGEIPKNIKRKLSFVPVGGMDEVLKHVLHPKPPKPRKKPTRK